MMRLIGLVSLAPCLVAAVASADEAEPKSFRFGKPDLGKLPAGWKAAKTNKGEGSVWKVVEDDTTPSKSGYALAQTASGPNALFNLCVADKTGLKDVEVQASLKAIDGELDRGGGVVWRYADSENYYVCRYNPLEDNFRLYKVVASKRTQLATREGLKSAEGKWHTLKVRHVGDRIECWLDGTKHLDEKDATFTKAGKVGLWSKADARTRFDGFQATAVGK
jgi:hypothetical protein